MTSKPSKTQASVENPKMARREFAQPAVLQNNADDDAFGDENSDATPDENATARKPAPSTAYSPPTQSSPPASAAADDEDDNDPSFAEETPVNKVPQEQQPSPEGTTDGPDSVFPKPAPDEPTIGGDGVRPRRKENGQRERDDFLREPEEEIGLLWLKERNGKKYCSGFVNVGGTEIRVLLFKNHRKTTSDAATKNWPDYILVKARKQD